MHTRIALMITGLLAAAVVPLIAAPAQAAPGVQITYVYYDSPGTDNGSNASLNAEYVRLKNTTSHGVRLAGWTLRDAQRHVYTFTTYTLPAGKTVTIHTGRGTDTARHRYQGRRWYVWNNTTDTAYLRNAAGKAIDSCHWTTAKPHPGYKYC